MLRFEDGPGFAIGAAVCLVSVAGLAVSLGQERQVDAHFERKPRRETLATLRALARPSDIFDVERDVSACTVARVSEHTQSLPIFLGCACFTGR